MSLLDIRIGTLVQPANCVETIRQIIPHGFESFQIMFWQTIGDVDLRTPTTRIGSPNRSATRSRTRRTRKTGVVASMPASTSAPTATSWPALPAAWQGNRFRML